MNKAAILSDDRKYRYVLWRNWDKTKGEVVFIGLNPSTADETEDDPTIRRCISFATYWGFGGVCMLNLFAYRATQPNEMKNAVDPIGPENDYYLMKYIQNVPLVIACWGNHGAYMGRHLFFEHIPDIVCFGTTKTGQPKHPLYLKSDSVLVPYYLEVNI